MRRLLLLPVILLAFATALVADTGAGNLLIPIAGRTAGAYGTQWQTDLVVTNLRPTPASVSVTFYPTTGRTNSSFTTLPISGYGTIHLKDVIGTSLLTDGIGFLRVNSATPDARLIARAYIYNRGNASGEYGQGIQAVPVDSLEREHVIGGLSPAAGTRTNVGFANPWPIEASLIVEMRDATGQLLNTIYPRVPAHQVLQINDIFGAMSVTAPGAVSLRVTSAGSYVYPYASVVRNDTGDAILVGGSGVALGNQQIATPQCSEPAALFLAKAGTSAGDWIVIFDPAVVDTTYLTNVIVPSRGVTVKHLYEHAFLGFLAELTPQQIAALRCETGALAIQENVLVPVP